MKKKNTHTILGAVAGDVIGSVYEARNIKTTNFPLFSPGSDFTDDTVLTIAAADAILNGKSFAESFWNYGRRYSNRGFGGMFLRWLREEHMQPYGSFGNGSAMRVSPAGFACDTLDETLRLAMQSAVVTHNHPEGIKGAQATAAAIYLARTDVSKEKIRGDITGIFGYDLDFTLDEIRPHYEFNVTCQGSVPQAIVAFLESSDIEDAIRLAISIGGDSDTIACIAGGIASAYYRHIPDHIVEQVHQVLPDEFMDTITRFDENYGR